MVVVETPRVDQRDVALAPFLVIIFRSRPWLGRPVRKDSRGRKRGNHVAGKGRHREYPQYFVHYIFESRCPQIMDNRRPTRSNARTQHPIQNPNPPQMNASGASAPIVESDLQSSRKSPTNLARKALHRHAIAPNVSISASGRIRSLATKFRRNSDEELVCRADALYAVSQVRCYPRRG